MGRSIGSKCPSAVMAGLVPAIHVFAEDENSGGVGPDARRLGLHHDERA